MPTVKSLAPFLYPTNATDMDREHFQTAAALIYFIVWKGNQNRN